MSNFENQIKQQGESFSIEPREEVWKRVEAELDKKKPGRFIGWWWMAALVLILGTGTVFYFIRQPVKPLITGTSKSDHPAMEAPGNQQASKIIKPENTTIQQPDGTSPTNKVHPNSGINKKAESKFRNHIKPTAGIKKDFNNTPTQKPPHTKIITSSNAAKPAVLDDAVKKWEKSSGPTSSLHNKSHALIDTQNAVQAKNINPGLSGKKDFLVVTEHSADHTTYAGTMETTAPGIIKKEANGDGNFPATAIDSAVTTISIPPATPNYLKEKVKWRFLLSAGLANNSKNSFLVTDKNSLPAAADPLNNSGGGTNAVVSTPQLPNKGGASFSIALERDQWLGKRWQWQSAISTQYQSIKQTTGARKDSAISLSTGNRYSAAYYYTGGNTMTHNGNNFRAFLSTNIAFSLLKQKQVLLLSCGLYSGINLHNNYLVPDYNNRRFVKANGLYKSWFAGINLDIEYHLNKGTSIGLTAVKDITSSFEPPNGPNLYWNSVQLKIGIPVSR